VGCELADDGNEVVGQTPSGFGGDVVGDHLVVGLGDAAGHACKCIGISPE